MSGTQRSLATNLAASADNITGNFTNQNMRDVLVSVPNIAGTTIAAAGTTQGTATSLTSHTHIITSGAAGTGVIATLPFHKVYNRGTASYLLYPASGANFEGLASNIPITILVGDEAEVIMTTTTQGYVGLAAPPIIRSTMFVDNIPGIIFGSGQTQTVQQANATALQAAVTAAIGAGQYIQGNSDPIQIYNSTGIVFFPTNGWFRWDGDPGQSIISQANGAAPILVLGDTAGVVNTGSSVFSGIWVNYVGTTTGNTGATAVQLGVAEFSLYERIKIASGINQSTGVLVNPPYTAFAIAATTNQFFSNTVRDILITGGQQYMWLNSLGGTQNLYENIYMSNGGGPSGFSNALGSNTAMKITNGNAQYGDVYNLVNMEWCSSGANLIQFDVARGVVINGLRFEGCHLTGASPSMIGLVHASVVINGLQILNQRMLTASPDSVTGIAGIAGSFGGSDIIINNLDIVDTTAGVKTATWQMFNETGTADQFASAVYNAITLGNVQGTMQWDTNMPTASNPVPQNATSGSNKTESYKYRHLFSQVVCAELSISTATYTHYGQYTDAIIICPANPAQAIAITLSNLMRPSGVGSSQKVATGNRVTVRMLTGTNSGGFAITVVDSVSAGTLSTITTPATTVDYVFNTTTANQWAIVT